MTTGNPLADCGLPRFFAVGHHAAHSSQASLGKDVVRFYGRSLVGMQKEALVHTSAAGGAWRLASDEGAYLNGLDEAPCPLAFMTAGMAASFMHAIQARLAAVGVPHDGVRLIQDNSYTMQGSMPRRTMIGGALPVQLQVELPAGCDAEGLSSIVAHAVESSPASSLLRQALRNTFTLTVNGLEVEPETLSAPAHPPPPVPRAIFDGLVPAESLIGPLVERVGKTPLTEEATSHAGSSYAPEQHRTLHLRGVCTVRRDGVKVIEQHLYNPHGSIFRLLSDESPANGGSGRAPDANTYMSAGIGFCFMTQLGRFAKISGRRLDGYAIVQDTCFATGHAEPAVTHVYLDTPEDEAFARDVLHMGERTCFLHALCRTALTTDVRVTARDRESSPAW